MMDPNARCPWGAVSFQASIYLLVSMTQGQEVVHGQGVFGGEQWAEHFVQNGREEKFQSSREDAGAAITVRRRGSGAVVIWGALEWK